MKNFPLPLSRLACLLLAGAGLTVQPARAQMNRMMDFSNGCPFCNPGGDQGSGDAPRPGHQLPPPARPPTPPPAAAPAALSPPVAAAWSELKKDRDGYWEVDFGHLASYILETPALDAVRKPGSVGRIPVPVRELDGRDVRVSGFMLPIKMENGLVTEFLVIRSPMVCCYGVIPAPNEWVVVKMQGPGVRPAVDQPLVFRGTLHVGEIYDSDTFAGVYRLDGETVSAN